MRIWRVVPLFLVLLFTAATQICLAFLLPGRKSGITKVSLRAKATKRKKKQSPSPSSLSGGFGQSPASKPEVDDYAAFPALERSVKDTILPVHGSISDEEMYGRLDQIYGFPSFNYESPSDNQADRETMSFTDMLASQESETSGNALEFDDLLTKSSTPAADLSDLLAAATGGQTSAEPLVGESQRTDLSLSSLPSFSDVKVLHVDPMVISVDNFFTEEECDRYISMSEHPSTESPFKVRSKTVGRDALAKAQRTSTTWFHHYKDVPELIAKASRLLGLDGINRWEEPQTVRYRRNEKFTWHLDALAPSDDLADKGGQRTVTLLVYLTDLSESDGGATIFRDLGGSDGPLRVRPKKGSSLVFFPAAGGIPNAPFDIRTLHCGEVVSQDASKDKWIAQLWLRETPYKPTAPTGNTHEAAFDAVSKYCSTNSAH